MPGHFLAARAPTTAGPLRFRADGSFQISIFEDLHFGENAWDAWGPEQDRSTVRVLATVLDAETPDLVVLNGDLITGENTFRANSTTYLDQLVAPLVRRGRPWAATYGNHDSAVHLSRSALLAREKEQWPGLSRTANMFRDANDGSGGGDVHDDENDDEAGVTNYYLPVYGSDCTVNSDTDVADRCVPRLLLWFFDSRGGFAYQPTEGPPPVGLPNWVDARVVAWYTQTQAALEAKYAPMINDNDNDNDATPARPFVLPALVFVHIPPNAARALQLAGAGPDSHRQPGINDDRPLAQQAQGWCPGQTRSSHSDGGGRGTATTGTCAYGGQDEPFMRAVAAAGNGTGVLALFSGHDHGDTWCQTWDERAAVVPGVTGTGVHVCFGQHTGYGGYGTWTRGGRQVRITEQDLAEANPHGGGLRRRADVETWIRLETGAVVGAVTLNATYGRDVYPATPNTHTHCPTCDSAAAEPATAAAAASPKLQLQTILQYFGWSTAS
ncbi:Metallophosphoesterase domain protein [Niveomyces insectorum RCEF 264]|uniref:Metallophosphoesterase domain protein n=1 Tax=Niveomyces insectorum RCEF 264 TaxID=1081102 RepID=A0A167XXG7_9HYPO|nr:Metallophosphoesterase domain protein [Niveomyces insectorum RCEF 264]